MYPTRGMRWTAVEKAIEASSVVYERRRLVQSHAAGEARDAPTRPPPKLLPGKISTASKRRPDRRTSPYRVNGTCTRRQAGRTDDRLVDHECQLYFPFLSLLWPARVFRRPSLANDKNGQVS